ncbi:unnamed protein product, partial [Amoebophrya sp. A25]|eukprot:GSA25T00027822001.1
MQSALKLQPEPVRETATHRISDILGIELHECKRSGNVTLSQDTYVSKLLERFGGDSGKK